MRFFERPFLTAALLSLVVLYATGFGAEADDGSTGPWPQWRGPEGLGVSSERNLPEKWDSDSRNIRWKTEIPGEGVSSPVVSNGRVILTTAYESPKAVVSQNHIALAGLGLAIIFLTRAVIDFFGGRRKRARKKMLPAESGLPGRFEVFLGWFTSFAFIGLALLVTAGRKYCDSVFGGVGLIVLKLGFGDTEHLCSIYQGIPAADWLTLGGIAFLGLAVCVGWLRAHSIWRLLGVGVVGLCAFYFMKLTPSNQWMEKIELPEKLAFIFPGLVIASWHLLKYFEVRCKPGVGLPKNKTSTFSERINTTLEKLNHLEIRWKHENMWRIGGVRSVFFVVLLASLSLLVFIPPNFFEAQLGFQRVVVCVDMKTGNLLWERTVFVAPTERKHADSTYATPTAAADGRHIIASFGVGVACLDFEGNVLWREPDPGYTKNTRYGAACSVVLAGDTVIVVQEREHGSNRPTWIAAFDKQTGNARWKITPESIHECFTTPLVYRDENNAQLIVATWGSVVSFDIESGRRLWVKTIHTEQLVASPTRAGAFLCVGGGTWGPNATIMMRLNSVDEGAAPDIIWQSDKDTPGNCSPVIYDGKLFTVTDTGRVTCFDAESGEMFWNKRLKGGRYLSSLVAGDGKVYVCNTKGLTTVIAAEAKFKILSENNLMGRCLASPAVADGCILLRIANYLYCIEKER